MLRMFLVVFAWPLLVALLAWLITWYRAEFPEPTTNQLLSPSQFRLARASADQGLENLRALPPGEQERLMDRLDRALQEPAAWLARLEQRDYRIICLGEYHEPSTRRFLADTFFSRYRVDVLLLEATPAELERINEWIASGRDYVPLLEADIREVLAAAHRLNPDVVVRGIEETREQIRARDGHEGSRDRSLVRNFWQAWQPGKRNVILYGALHCSTDPTWLYHHLREQLPPREDVPMYNVRVIGTGQDESTRAFVYFLEALGIGRDDFVIPDTTAVPPQVREWFPFFNQQALERYQSLVVFHNTPQEMAAGAGAGTTKDLVGRAPGSKDTLPQWYPVQ